jgi:N-acetylglucosamine-6-sulfatase
MPLISTFRLAVWAEGGRRRRRVSLSILLALPVATLCGCGSSTAVQSAVSQQTASVSVVPPALAAASDPTGGTPVGAGTAPTRPNIVFVLTDDLASNLVRYMPHVLSMERHGETFSNYFVTDSLCCPSRASILTGRFPHDTAVFSNEPPYGGFPVFHERGEEQQTFAVALQAQGYRTAMMGKYLNGYQPDSTEGGATPYVPPGWNEWDVAGDGYPEFDYAMNSDGTVSSYGEEPQDYLTDVLADKSLRFIDQSAARHRPFMLEIAPFAPHAPFTPAPRDATDFPGLRAPRNPAFNAATIGAPAWLRDFLPLRPGQIRKLNRQFRKRAQAVQAVDRMIGEIEAELRAKGLARSTYLVFSSDNGLHMGEHRLIAGKLTAFDSDIKVPLVVVGPGVPSGRSVSAMAENIDLCPTFEQLGGAPVPSSVDGHSLTTLLHGAPATKWRREILVEHHGPDIGPKDPDLPTRGAGNPPSYEAIRTPASLYVEYATGEREYYDLHKDPFELRNLAAELSPAHERRLHNTLRRIADCHGTRECWRAQHGRA